MDVIDTIQMINVDKIIPNRFQPRLTFDEKGISELASSIKEHGIIQPLVLRKLGDKYEIIAGERRYKAANVAGLTEVPAIISNLDDNQSAEVALVENVQRKNLTSIEEAKSYKKILDKGYLTQEGLAKKMGVSQSLIANKLRLLNLSTGVQEALLNDRISERHARSLLQITDLIAQEAMLNRVISERMTVRQLDTAIKEELSPSTPVISEPAVNPFNYVNNAENEQVLDSGKEMDFQDIKRDAGQAFETLDFSTSEDLILDDKPIDPIPPAEKEIKESNKFLNIFDMPSYQSLEDQKVNLSFDQSSENIFDTNNEEQNNSLLEPIESPIKEIEPSPIVEKKSKIISNDLNSITEAFRDLEIEIKNAGFKISKEEFNFEDLYQIIIKIDKQAK
ncbi:MAG: ParB/RepB/Spo0J family partition protein [Bacilli bacterium]|nr:ParB/RepB/Spo0J family partition protein [Bacilli bacterium]